MDQFRGYTVAGMFLVNFVGGLALFPEVLKHHNGHPYFSYADSIMPNFMFAAGFSYRLVALQRLEQVGAARTYAHFLVRSLALVLISLVMYTHEDINEIERWDQVTPDGIWKLVAMLFKANLWEVLAVIGVTQILIMPVIAASTRVRTVGLIACTVVHLVISYFFNFFFVYGKPNWLDGLLGLTGKSAWDGGFFGPIGWAIPMLFGTIAYDIVSNRTPAGAAARTAVRPWIDHFGVRLRPELPWDLIRHRQGDGPADRQGCGRLAGDSPIRERARPLTGILARHASVHGAAIDRSAAS